MTTAPCFRLSRACALFVFALTSSCGDSDPASNGDAGTLENSGDGDGDAQQDLTLEGSFVYQCLGANCPAGPCTDSVRDASDVDCRDAYPDALGENASLCKAGLVGTYCVKITPDDTRDWKKFKAHVVHCDEGKVIVEKCENGYEGTGEVYKCT